MKSAKYLIERNVAMTAMRILCLCFGALFTLQAFGATQESLLIGPGDLLHVQVADTPEMEQHPRVTDAGDVPITGIGTIKVAGLTPADAALAIQAGLIAAHYMNHPAVMVSVEQYATQSVSVLGEVKAPGAYPIATSRSILDVLALAGGLTTVGDRNLVIERHGDPSQVVHYGFSNNAGQAIVQQVVVYPGDVVIVPKAGIVYVLGDVNHPGGYVMGNNDSTMTVLQALAVSGGVTHTAKQGHARLIRKDAAGRYSDRQISVGDLQEGRTPDIALQAGDVLYVPFSFGRNIVTAGAGSIASAATTAAVYALP